MSSLDAALKEVQAVRSLAHEGAMTLKNQGLLGTEMTAGLPLGSLSTGMERNRDAQRYGLFRGWVHAAINALAQEAAGQPVYIAEMTKAEPREAGERRRLSREKAHHIEKMTPTVRRKASQHTGGMEVLEDHPLLDALENPNPIQYRWQFVYSFVANLNLTGRAYVIGGENEEGRLEFYSPPTNWVRPDHEDGPFSKFRIVNPKNPAGRAEDQVFDRSQVAMAHFPNPSDPLSCLAPAQAQSMGIQIDDHIQTSQDAFFKQGMFPSAIITIGSNPHPNVPAGIRPRLSPAQLRQVRGIIMRRHQSVANYGSPAIIDGMIEKIERWSATQNEMGWDKSEKKVKERILSAFAVHEYVLGATVNVGGHAQAFAIEKRFCRRVNTFLDMLGCVMSEFAAPMAEETSRLTVWWEQCEPIDHALRSLNMREARKNGDITENEFRAFLGMPPSEERVARSKLVDTVGGMTGYVQIMNAVGLETMSPEAAAVALVEFLQIPEETARNMVGVGSVETVVREGTESLREAIGALRIHPKAIAKQLALASEE